MSTSQDSQRHSHLLHSSSKMNSETAGIFKKEIQRDSSLGDYHQSSQKKYKTPNRNRNQHIGQTSKIVDQLKETVFQIASQAQENATAIYGPPCSPHKDSSPQKRYSPQKQPITTLGDTTNVAFGRSSDRASVSPMAAIQIKQGPDTAITNFSTDYNRPESPAKLAVQPQMYGNSSQSTAKRQASAGGPRTPNSSKRNKVRKLSKNDSQNLNVARLPSSESNLAYLSPIDQLQQEFMQNATLDQNLGDSKNDLRSKNLEIKQLQNALGALSEKLKLFQNIDSERDLVANQLSEVQQARSDLKKVLHETQQKTNSEFKKMEQYQEILLKENQTISTQCVEQNQELNSKTEECDRIALANSLMKKELDTLKLQLADLKGYKEKYEKTASTTLKTQETQLQELHSEIERMAMSHAKQMEQVHQDKEVLIQQNSQLKQALSDSMNANEQLKSQVESFHGKLINVEAQLQSEKKQILKMKACQGDFGHLEIELKEARSHNTLISSQVEELVLTMKREQSVAESKLAKILDDKNQTDFENKSLSEDIRIKDEIIKKLTKENLLINSKVTQLQKLLCSQEDQDSTISELNRFVDQLNYQREGLKTNYERCSNKLLEVEEKCQESQTLCMQLLTHCKIKDEEIERLTSAVDELQEKVDDQLFLYKPLKDDPVDQGLANYINRAPVRIRSKMDFERESPGIYRYHRKKVFMKIEQETIVIRVGGGFLTLDEFVALYCGGELEQQKKITNLVYGGKCAGSKEFKTFYFSQHNVPDQGNGSKTPQPRVDTQVSDNYGGQRATTPDGNPKWTVDEPHREKSNPRRRQ